TGIRHLREGELWNDRAQVEQRKIPQGWETVLRWQGGSGEHRLTTHWHFSSEGDLLVTQRAECATGGLVGMQWGFAIPTGWELLLPVLSGFRLTPEMDFAPLRLEYPYPWEAQCVIVSGKRGGFLIHAEDDMQHFKRLFVQKQGRQIWLGLESWCHAPFDGIQQAESVRWRVRAYKGSWLNAAATYRGWMEERFALSACRRLHPDWVEEIQIVVIDNLDDPERLKALAQQLPPRRTLIYVPAWRARGYDRYYPDYTPREGFAEQVRRAREMGFRVMLHVNYFGCHLEHPDYERLRDYHHLDPMTKEPVHWEWRGEDPPIQFAYINPAAKAWRELFTERMVELCRQAQPDALHIDQSALIVNDGRGLVDGMNAMQGNLALHRQLLEALPGVALSGEGLSEVTFRYESFAQRHVWGLDSVSAHLVPHHIAAAHAVSSSLFTPHTRLYGYLGMINPFGWRVYAAWRTAYDRQGILPTFAWLETEQLAQPDGVMRALLEEARWFAQHRPQPHFAPEKWRRGTLFLYRTAEGQLARYYQSTAGVSLQVHELGGWKTVSQRVEGVERARVRGSIAGWLAYRGREVFGLNPASSYPWSPEPPDRDALHLRYLSEHFRLSAVCLQEGQWACFSFEPEEAVEGVAELFCPLPPLRVYLDGEVVGGERLAPRRYRYALPPRACRLVLIFAQRAPLPLPTSLDVGAYPLQLETDRVVEQLVQYGHGMLPTVTPEERARLGLFAQPLHDGRVFRAVLLHLPPHALLLRGSVQSLLKEMPLRLSVEVNGREMWNQRVEQAGQPLSFEVPLSAWAGQLSLLRFIAEAPANYLWNQAQWSDVRIG
ncbi:MAG: DUF6259 domain-containing protein, partial [Armatimonadota bacterium]|nr:DUF6259 domain-containing protein [Armatimonadota bacterium]